MPMGGMIEGNGRYETDIIEGNGRYETRHARTSFTKDEVSSSQSTKRGVEWSVAKQNEHRADRQAAAAAAAIQAHKHTHAHLALYAYTSSD